MIAKKKKKKKSAKYLFSKQLFLITIDKSFLIHTIIFKI